ncbi:hypothetical protein lerEdw1_014522 [Lerista edwardsae]|nr:hypothetical protein lerEdw1_014522 [Lerista edwardsae]
MASGDPLVRSVQGVLAMVQGFYGTLFGWTEGCSPRVLRTFQATDDSDARNRQIASRRLSESQAASLVQAITDNEPPGLCGGGTSLGLPHTLVFLTPWSDHGLVVLPEYREAIETCLNTWRQLGDLRTEEDVRWWEALKRKVRRVCRALLATVYWRELAVYHRALLRHLRDAQRVGQVGHLAARRAGATEGARILADFHQRKRAQQLRLRHYRANGPLVEEPAAWAWGGKQRREEARPMCGLRLMEGDAVEETAESMLGVLGSTMGISLRRSPWRLASWGCAAFNAALRGSARFGNAFHSGLLRFLFKGGDPTLLKDWRPLTITNVDYRLLARVLNSRLAAVMRHLVFETQSSAVPGRRMSRSLVLLQEVFTAAAQGRWRGLLLTAAPVPLASGLRQGCPLSPLLYVLALDPLLRAIQADERIEGLVTRSGRRLKALAHADVMYVNPKERLWQS